MNECRRVHAHKREQRAKIQQLGSLLVRNQKSPDECYRADEDHVVARNAILRIKCPKEFLGNTVAAAHPVKQASGSELRAHSRSDIRDEHGEVEQGEKKKPPYLSRPQWKCRLDHVLRKRLRAPNQLCGINFERRQNTRNHAHQHGCKHHVAPRVLDLLGQGGNCVEPDIGKYRDRGTAEDTVEAESFRIVKGLREKTGAVLVKPPNQPKNKRKKR